MNSEDEIYPYIDHAWGQVGQSTCDLDIPDVIAYCDIGNQWPQYRKHIKDIILQEEVPNHIDLIDLPKGTLMLRPLVRIDIDYRLAFEASVHALSRTLDNELSSNVHSYRLIRKTGRIRNGVAPWKIMHRTARRLFEKGRFEWLLRTDISSFYENINIDELLRMIANTDGPEWAKSYIDRILRQIQHVTNVPGLPQGTNVSGVLSNYYLKSLDETIQQEGFPYFRYSDDIYIFGNSWAALCRLLFEMTQVLRLLNLSLSNEKTNIYSGPDIEEFEEGKRKERFTSALETEAPSAEETASRDFLRKKFDCVIQKSEISSRDLKFCLNHLANLNDRYAAEWVLENIKSFPHLARELLFYLWRTYRTDRTHRLLVRLLQDPEINLYPFAIQHILIYMVRDWDVNYDPAIDVARQITKNRNYTEYVREIAARYLGRNKRQYEFLRKVFQGETAERVRRSILVSCYETGAYEERWLKEVERANSGYVGWTARYLLNSPDFIPTPYMNKAEWIHGNKWDSA